MRRHVHQEIESGGCAIGKVDEPFVGIDLRHGVFRVIADAFGFDHLAQLFDTSGPAVAIGPGSGVNTLHDRSRRRARRDDDNRLRAALLPRRVRLDI